jgi:hypothetical protein
MAGGKPYKNGLMRTIGSFFSKQPPNFSRRRPRGVNYV